MTGSPDVALGVHLTFGSDPATSMVVSWLTRTAVPRPQVRFGPAAGGSTGSVTALTRSYTDALTNEVVFAHHAHLSGLLPAADYRYDVGHDGRWGLAHGSFRTAPRHRAAFSFTCFGDQGTDEPHDPYGSAASRHVITGVERLAPLFNLANGDLSYANQRTDPVRAWFDWFAMISASARFRPWMPCNGNHETERGNGALGLAAYQTYFALPQHDEEAYLAGLWYAFTVGGVRFVMLSAADVCYQDSGRVYLHGYSAGRQTSWLRQTLKQARADPGIDWIVVGMHHAAVSTAVEHNGADLGIREEWLPLFDTYEVDLVLCGHEHHYERTHPLRGVVPDSATRTPRPVPGATTPARKTADGAGAAAGDGAGDLLDTSAGTVHLLVGTGGSSSPSAHALFDPPACWVIVGVHEQDPGRWHRQSVRAREDAPWLAFRAPEHPYAFAAFEVDPGEPGGSTSIRVTVYDSSAPTPVPFDRFTLVRPRADAAVPTT
ncbi:putative phosphohydrolase [Frankia casuarinae]|uniref:purple acid phosphatase family protein n=1 Tax=Frankia sp. BMG5.23 TaxID=683305 RepID=UPI0002F956F0|nr:MULTISPECIES: metallophosphoesterase family protein [Frankia]EYT93071.1 putative phosphohydrolase [Frankia casuarinae]KDA44105.1 putative phosphohydrolase [Frankia sp. BMG5.23]